MDWGSFWGSITGAAATFIAFFFTYRLSKKQNAITRLQINEQNRIVIQPLLTLAESVNGIMSDGGSIILGQKDVGAKADTLPENMMEKKTSQIIGFKNIGQATAANVIIYYPGNSSGMSLGHLDRGQCIRITFYCPFSRYKYEWKIELIYSDISGRMYSQTVPVECFLETGPGARTDFMVVQVSNSTFPKLIQPHD